MDLISRSHRYWSSQLLDKTKEIASHAPVSDKTKTSAIELNDVDVREMQRT